MAELLAVQVAVDLLVALNQRLEDFEYMRKKTAGPVLLFFDTGADAAAECHLPEFSSYLVICLSLFTGLQLSFCVKTLKI